MSPRSRSPRNRDLPPHLYVDEHGYRYRRPDGKEVRVGQDRQAAVSAALELNRHFYGSLADRVTRDAGRTVSAFLDKHLDVIMRERELAPATKRDWRDKEKKIREAFGDRVPATITLGECSAFLSAMTPYQSNHYRTQCNVLWRYMIVHGWLGERPYNPWPDTLTRRTKVSRERLTLDAYRAIWTAASELPKVGTSIQNGMDLALHTLARRADISKWRRTDYEREAQTLQVIQSKTGAAIRFHVGPPLRAVLERCLNDGVASQWIIHQPVRAGKGRMAHRLSPESLTRGFKEARDRTGLYDTLPEGRTPPSFHEIRALGAELYRKAGLDEREIQQLLGHEDVRQTKVYLSRHEREYTDVFGGLILT